MVAIRTRILNLHYYQLSAIRDSVEYTLESVQLLVLLKLEWPSIVIDSIGQKG